MGVFIRAALLLRVTLISDSLDFPVTEGVLPTTTVDPPLSVQDKVEMGKTTLGF